MKFVHWLTLVFVVAKITGYIDWSWWLVFSPLAIAFIVIMVDKSINK